MAKAAEKKNPDNESDRERRRRYEQKMTEAGKRALENARDIPPELFKTMENPASTMDGE
jgi:hypothetical protein